ncbi:MAG: hypothetical protein A2Y77_03735 [Planctomycetes bacterium RBG_13_62_9]|nr:MAG: hypothetical protein A2Y77_03735 [Planctomycetes bacterium RBG_13_62_9]
MNARRYFERNATVIATLDREQVKKQIKNFRGRFPLDFTDDYLDATSLDRLRHILLGVMMTNKTRC